MIDVALIRDRVALLAKIDRERQVFGAAKHEYRFAPALGAAELEALEASLGVKLPADYRRLVREVGASGAGPYYGLDAPAAPEGGAPARGFPWRPDAKPPRRDRLDGVVVLAQQGCGMRSVLVVSGELAGEVWTDLTADGGPIRPEAASVAAWYEAWIERALVEWIELAAPRIALDGPDDPAELEAVAIGFEAVAASAERRTLGYLHLRERRYDDAASTFAAAAAGSPASAESDARAALDRARLAHVRGAHREALVEIEHGLAASGIWYATRDQMRAIQERLLLELGRRDDALRVLDERAAERYLSFDLHHRLARERLARNDVDGAGAALERAASMGNILGQPAPLEVRVPPAFEPIIEELRAAGRGVDAQALEARAEMILGGN